jgi:hypothetical protein
VVGWSFMVEVGHDGALWTPVLTDPKVVLAGGGTKDHKANPVTTRFAHLPLDENVNGLMAQGDTAGDAK